MHNWKEALVAYVADSRQSNAANPRAVLFGRDYHNVLLHSPSATYSLSFAAHVGFVDLNASGQSVAPGANHRTAQLVQPRPDRLIALETKLTLQSQSTNPIFLAGDQPHGQEPELQRLPRPLEKGPRRDGCLTMAGRTFPQTLSSRRPSSVHFTFRTSKTVRPPKSLQIGTTIP